MEKSGKFNVKNYPAILKYIYANIYNKILYTKQWTHVGHWTFPIIFLQMNFSICENPHKVKNDYDFHPNS